MINSQPQCDLSKPEKHGSLVAESTARFTMLSIKRMDKLLEKMSRGEAWTFPAKIPDDDAISVYSVDVEGGRCDKMASLIPSSGILFNLCDTAPSPCKDYCQIIVSDHEVSLAMYLPMTSCVRRDFSVKTTLAC